MATDDQQVLVAGTAAAPASFTVPGNGQIQPKAIFAHFNGTSAATSFVPAIKVFSDGGELVAICPCPTTVAAAGSADVSWFPHVAFTEAAAATAGVTLEQLLLDPRVQAGVTSSTVLQSGEQYVVTVQGTWSWTNSTLPFGGTPNPDAMFPTSGGQPRVSTQVGTDAETLWAEQSGPPTGYPLGHFNWLQMNIGSGWSHVEPQGGPYTTPQPNYLYRYSITGQGSTASFRIFDNGGAGPYADNYGYLQVTIQGLGGSSGGGGGGSLLPPTGPDYSILRAESGVPTWEARPDIVESDLSLSNVTTADVSTTRHGFAPKAPNDATKFLDGTGNYSAPSGASPLTTKGDLYGYSTTNARIPVGADTTVLTADSTQALGVKWAAPGGGITDLTSSGGTITVTTPTGPTTNVDLPTTGVSAGTYGDAGHVARVTVDAEGRLTAASSVAISGTPGSGLVLLFDSTLGSDAASIDTGAGGISTAYTTLLVFAVARSTAASVQAAGWFVVNNDGGNNYSRQFLLGNQGTASAGANPSTAPGTGTAFNIVGANATANNATSIKLDIPNYSGTTFLKQGIINVASVEPGSAVTSQTSFLWANTAAISRLALFGQTMLKAGSRLTIYGT